MPRRPLTNVDLQTYVKKLMIPCFRGIYMRDSLPKRIRSRRECGIVNLDKMSGPGSHWTAYIKRGGQVKYFDSLGNLKPPKELIKYFGSDGNKNNIYYNHERYQNINSYNCGHLCLMFLYLNARKYLNTNSCST